MMAGGLHMKKVIVGLIHTIILLAISIGSYAESIDSIESTQFDAKRLDFTLGENKAFIILPTQAATDGSKPWIWYAPTFIGGHPDPTHTWMAKQLLNAGFFICGIEVGESYGSPTGTKAYSVLYDHLVINYKLDKKPCLLPQSRGGLMLLNWARENAKRVGCIAGIYTVCNIESYPGVARASGAYEMTSEKLQSQLKQYNPIDGVKPLVDANVPMLFIHGDSDKVVPIEKNAGLFVERSRALGSDAKLITVAGRGHEICPEFFESQEFIEFLLSKGASLRTTKK